MNNEQKEALFGASARYAEHKQGDTIQLVPFWSPLALAMGRKESSLQAGFYPPIYSRQYFLDKRVKT